MEQEFLATCFQLQPPGPPKSNSWDSEVSLGKDWVCCENMEGKTSLLYQGRALLIFMLFYLYPAFLPDLSSSTFPYNNDLVR